MRFARVSRERATYAVTVTGDRVTPVPVIGPQDSSPHADPLLELLRSGGWGAPLAGSSSWDLAECTVLSPLRRPGKIVAIGLNYADHTTETGFAAPKRPLSFAKYPTSIIGPGEDIVVRAEATVEPDFEGELAAVIGTACGPQRRGTLADIAAYTIANDVSARDAQREDQQWSRSKSMDTFCPLGPMLVTAEDFGDPQQHRITTTVNGETRQDAPTSDMVFGVATLLHSLTATMTLEPGDVVLTGTPPGVGGFADPPVFLRDGDTVTVRIDGLGALTNAVRYADAGQA